MLPGCGYTTSLRARYAALSLSEGLISAATTAALSFQVVVVVAVAVAVAVAEGLGAAGPGVRA